MAKVFITGMARGFGKPTARALLAKGHDVAGSVRSRVGRSAATVAELEAAGARIVEMDVTDSASTDAGAALPHMRAQGRGTVLYTSSLIGRIATPFYGTYMASKWALEAIVGCYRTELSGFGIESCRCWRPRPTSARNGSPKRWWPCWTCPLAKSRSARLSITPVWPADRTLQRRAARRDAHGLHQFRHRADA